MTPKNVTTLKNNYRSFYENLKNMEIQNFDPKKSASPMYTENFRVPPWGSSIFF